jgi:hypothetical protein
VLTSGFNLFTGTAGVSPVRAPSGATNLATLGPTVELALRARGGRDARGPVKSLSLKHSVSRYDLAARFSLF